MESFYLKKFRTCDQILNPLTLQVVKNSSNLEPKIITTGFYHNGTKGDILALYVSSNGSVVLQHNSSKYNLSEREIYFSCKHVTKNDWMLETFTDSKLKNDIFVFTYEQYVYFSNDDDGLEDVNFGLWIIDVLQNEIRKRVFISANHPSVQKPTPNSPQNTHLPNSP